MIPIRLLSPILFVSLLLSTVGMSVGQTSELRNPTNRDVKQELVRLKTPAPEKDFVVKSDGRVIPHQVEEIGGTRWIWVLADFAPGAVRKFEVSSGKTPSAAPLVQVKREGDDFLLSNGLVSIRVPAVAGSGAPGPIRSFALGKEWVGESSWSTTLPLAKFSATVIGDGALFGKIRLRYDFEGKAGMDGATPAFAEIDVKVSPGQHHVEISERHAMGKADYWEFVASKGWKPNLGLSVTFSKGGMGDAGAEVAMDRPLKPGARPYQQPDLFINLIPRWNQSYKDGWFFAATDGSQALGATVVRASQWQWPHDNSICVLVKESGDYAAFRAPTHRGSRLWWIFGPGREPTEIGYVAAHAWEHLDKLNHDYILTWPGNEKGSLPSMNFYDGGQVNPTAAIRGMGRALRKSVGTPGSYSDFLQAQHMFHADAFGSYENFWSPQNANFFTDFNKVPIMLTTRLKAHPQFETLRKMAEDRLRTDMDHAITLPGGAGQECPGYQAYAVEEYEKIGEVTREHLGFDPTTWERYKAAKNFYARISQPDGDKRRALPMGDTHPDKKVGGPAILQVPAQEVSAFKTIELPGFGVIFNSKPGTAQETYVAFKSGPNRGHYHGDQLAIHYSANAAPVAVDHHASYHPRPGQEHMHNRLSFSTDAMPFANMDGYERLIAFEASPVADVAVGQVESVRLRAVKDLPPEIWDQRYPIHEFSSPLAYRRTVVLVKGGPQDYVVLRDQFQAPEPLTATFNLHVRSGKIEQKGSSVLFDNMTLFTAAPATPAFAALPWSHENGGLESTQGARLSVKADHGEFISVLYPGSQPPVMTAIPGGVKVGSDEIVFMGGTSARTDYPLVATQREGKEESQCFFGAAEGPLVTILRGGKEVFQLPASALNLDRPQGNVGLFIPDAGYPFGDVPDWLIRQRVKE